MSVSNADHGICRLNNDDEEQFFYESNDEVEFFETVLNEMAVGNKIGALGQEADQPSDASGNWSSVANAPFPGQCTTVMTRQVLSASKSICEFKTNVQTVRVLNKTIIPSYDTSAGMWKDQQATALAAGADFVIVADVDEQENLINSVREVKTASTATGVTIEYIQLTLLSADYFCAGSVTNQPAIYMAWDNGTTIF